MTHYFHSDSVIRFKVCEKFNSCLPKSFQFFPKLVLSYRNIDIIIIQDSFIINNFELKLLTIIFILTFKRFFKQITIYSHKNTSKTLHSKVHQKFCIKSD
jgi:hypothetical protein